MSCIEKIYSLLFEMYGPQGWWPLMDYKGINPTKTGSFRGYHPNDYELPSTPEQTYEVCCGAILTQNVGWANVEKALINLKRLKALCPDEVIRLDDTRLAEVIRPAGYFNQKARKLKEFTRFFLSLTDIPKREELLGIWGIGPETADSILLYAYKVPTFVVDAYTRRIFVNIGLITERANYDEVKGLFEKNLKRDLIVYQEYHALLVEHAKRYYLKKEKYGDCPLYKRFRQMSK